MSLQCKIVRTNIGKCISNIPITVKRIESGGAHFDVDTYSIIQMKERQCNEQRQSLRQ